jgi:hypothetical protein
MEPRQAPGGLRAARSATVIIVALLAVLLAFGCAPERPPRPPSGNVIVAAGDIANCSSEGDEATAKLVGSIDGATVLTLGDEAYPHGTAQDFRECYEPTWGQFKERTRPIPGNHEYETEGASAYFDYFGKVAGDPDEGYYSYDLGAWHIVALNSNCGEGEIRCGPGSAQTKWLKEDLAAHAADKGRCTLAYMHHPRFSSGEEHGSTPTLPVLLHTTTTPTSLIEYSSPFRLRDAPGRVRSHCIGEGSERLRSLLFRPHEA